MEGMLALHEPRVLRPLQSGLALTCAFQETVPSSCFQASVKRLDLGGGGPLPFLDSKLLSASCLKTEFKTKKIFILKRQMGEGLEFP